MSKTQCYLITYNNVRIYRTSTNTNFEESRGEVILYLYKAVTLCIMAIHKADGEKKDRMETNSTRLSS